MLKPVAVPLYQKGIVSSSDLILRTHIYVTLLCSEYHTPNKPHLYSICPTPLSVGLCTGQHTIMIPYATIMLSLCFSLHLFLSRYKPMYIDVSTPESTISSLLCCSFPLPPTINSSECYGMLLETKTTQAVRRFPGHQGIRECLIYQRNPLASQTRRVYGGKKRSIWLFEHFQCIF